jgi:hypothetical protein
MVSPRSDMNALCWVGLGIDYVSLRENKIKTSQYIAIQHNTMNHSRSIAIMDIHEKIEKKQVHNQEPHEIRDPHGILNLLIPDGSMRSRL